MGMPLLSLPFLDVWGHLCPELIQQWAGLSHAKIHGSRFMPPPRLFILLIPQTARHQTGHQVIVLKRYLCCSSCFFPTCLQFLSWRHPQQHMAGTLLSAVVCSVCWRQDQGKGNGWKCQSRWSWEARAQKFTPDGGRGRMEWRQSVRCG